MSKNWETTNIFLKQYIIELLKQDLDNWLTYSYLYRQYNISPYCQSTEIFSSFSNVLLHRGNSYFSFIERGQDSIKVHSNINNLEYRRVDSFKTIFCTMCIPYIKSSNGTTITSITPTYRSLVEVYDGKDRDIIRDNSLRRPIKINSSSQEICITVELHGTKIMNRFFFAENPSNYRLVRAAYASNSYKEGILRRFGNRVKEKKLYGNLWCISLDKDPTYQHNDLYYISDDYLDLFKIAPISIKVSDKVTKLLPLSDLEYVHDYGINRGLSERYSHSLESNVNVFFEKSIKISDSKILDTLKKGGEILLELEELRALYNNCCEMQVIWDLSVTIKEGIESSIQSHPIHSLAIIDK